MQSTTINPAFQAILSGQPAHLSSEEFMKFKVHCSAIFTSLQQWLQLAITFYRISIDQCIDLLAYVEKHEITRQSYRDYTHTDHKIRVYNCLAALYMCKDIKGEETGDQKDKAEKDKMRMLNTNKYINLAHSIKPLMGKTSLTLRGFILYYQGNFSQSLSSFTKAAETTQQDEEKPSVIGMLGLAQVLFAKRNYEGALSTYKKALKINKSLPTKARLGMAYCFYELEKYEMAMFCFKRILDLDPNCIEAILGYAVIRYQEGETDEYFPALKKCYELNPNHPLVLLHIAEHYLIIDSPDTEAVIQKGLQQVAKLPTFIDITDDLRNDRTTMRCKFNYLLGEIYYKRGQFDTCLKHYAQAINKHLPYTRINFAKAYINSNNYIQACKLIQQAIKLTPYKKKKLLVECYKTLAYIKSKSTIKKDKSELMESLEYYGEYLKYNPGDYESWIEFGNVLLENDLKRCEHCYLMAYEVLKGGVVVEGKEDMFVYPELLNNLGVLNAMKKDEKEAERYFNLAIQQIGEWQKVATDEPDVKDLKKKAYNISLYYNLGVFYDDNFRFAQAIQTFNKCLQINPLYIDSYIRLSFIYIKQGLSIESLQTLSKAQQLIEKTKTKYLIKDDILLARSYIFRILGDVRKAKDTLKDCHNDPYKRIFQQSLDYNLLMQRGESNTRNLKQLLKQKVKPGLKMIQEDPHNFYAVLFFGVLAATLEKHVEAGLCLNALKDMDNQHPIILFNLGVYYYNTEEHDKAFNFLKKYVDKMETVEKDAELLLSFILVIKGKYDEAITIIKKLIMMYPESLVYRYYLAFFTQKLSEKYLDADNRETKKVSLGISYIKKVKVIYGFLSKIRQDSYISHIAISEEKQRMRDELTRVREKSDDQKMYIRSREDKFGFYEKDAEMKERNTMDEKYKIINKANELRERKKKMLEEEERAREEEQERQREMLLRQREVEMKLNEEYLIEQKENDRGKEEKKMRQGGRGSKKEKSKKKKADYEDFIEPEMDEQFGREQGKKEREKERNRDRDREVNRGDDDEGEDMIEAPKRSGGRLKKKVKRESSDEEKYEGRNQNNQVRSNHGSDDDDIERRRAEISDDDHNQSDNSNNNSSDQQQHQQMQVQSPPSSDNEQDKQEREQRLLRQLEQDQE